MEIASICAPAATGLRRVGFHCTQLRSIVNHSCFRDTIAWFLASNDATSDEKHKLNGHGGYVATLMGTSLYETQ